MKENFLDWLLKMGLKIVGRQTNKRREIILSELRILFERGLEKNFDRRSTRIMLASFKRRHRIRNLEDLL